MYTLWSLVKVKQFILYLFEIYLDSPVAQSTGMSTKTNITKPNKNFLGFGNIRL